MIPFLSQTTWNLLMKKARAFMRLRPWLELDAHQVFGFYDPQTQRRYFGSVLGSGGMITGLYILPDENALYRYLNQSSYDAVDASLNQHAITFSLGSQDELFDEEYDLYEANQFKFTKQKYFIFHLYEPGYAPFVLNEEQARVMMLGFDVLKQLVKDIAIDEVYHAYYQDDDSMKIPVYTLCFKRWMIQSEDMKDYRYRHDIPSLDSLHLNIQDKEQSGTWEIGLLYLPTAVPSTHVNRAFFPQVLIVVSHDDNRIISILTKSEGQSPDVFLQSFMNLLEHAPTIPQYLVTRGKDTGDLFQEFDTVMDVSLRVNIGKESLIDFVWLGFVKFSQQFHTFKS